MPLPGARRAAQASSFIFACALLLACEDVVDPVFCTAPQIVRSSVMPGASNVLSATVTGSVLFADSVAVQFGRGQADQDTTPAVIPVTDSVLIPILGLLPSTEFTAELTAYNSCGKTSGDALAFTTAALPADLPSYRAEGSDPSPGYVVFAAGPYGIVVDNTGRVVWYHRFEIGPGLSFQAQPNGRYAARPPSTTAGVAGHWAEIDPLGNLTRTLACARGLDARIHDLIAQPDGSFWLFCDELRTVDLSSTGGSSQIGALGSDVQHIGADGTVLFDWSPFDHLVLDWRDIKASDVNAGVINWTHANALDLDDEGNLLISYRNPSELIKIDTRTGAVVWVMGGPANQFRSDYDAPPAFARQHGLRVSGPRQLQVLNNLGDPAASHAERYDYDEATHTFRLTASFTSSTHAIAQIGGSTQALPDGHTLVSFGNGASVEEYDGAGNVVWKLSGNPGYIFRAQRIQSLYHPGMGDPR